MTASNRATVLTKAHKILTKHYTPAPTAERTVLEQLLFACCLEDSRPEAATEAFARLQETFFDWNEVRVTTVRELAELMRGLYDPTRAATQLKQTLHSVFETIYGFDLEHLKKMNQGAAVKQLEQFRGATPFTVSYVVQHALGGHAIPICLGSMQLMYILGVATESDAKAGSVPGLERAIPKNKGVEFGSLIHQLAADLMASPFSPQVRSLLLEISPDAKDRLPRRGGAKKAEGPEEKKKVAKKSGEKKTAKKPTVTKKVPKTVKKKPTTAKKKAITTKKASKTPKKSTSKQLTRRKPR